MRYREHEGTVTGWWVSDIQSNPFLTNKGYTMDIKGCYQYSLRK